MSRTGIRHIIYGVPENRKMLAALYKEIIICRVSVCVAIAAVFVVAIVVGVIALPYLLYVQ